MWGGSLLRRKSGHLSLVFIVILSFVFTFLLFLSLPLSIAPLYLLRAHDSRLAVHVGLHVRNNGQEWGMEDSLGWSIWSV